MKSLYEKSVYQENVKLVYEPRKFTYVQTHTYTPDFQLPNGIYVETKGYFTEGKRLQGDKAKLLAVVSQHPEERLFLLFMSRNESMVAWAEKHGFEYAIGTRVPLGWYLLPSKGERESYE